MLVGFFTDSLTALDFSVVKTLTAQPPGKRNGVLHADSAAYQAEDLNYCNDHKIQYAICSDLDHAVIDLGEHIDADDWHGYQDGHIAETVHWMNKIRHYFGWNY